jgi:ABC-type Zn uptake system ZnuABC Zn-binding protein ZnuA
MGMVGVSIFVLCARQGSVQERIMELVEQRKTGMGPGMEPHSYEGDPRDKGKMKQQDVAGSIRADKHPAPR